MEETLFQHEPESSTQVIASSGPFQIELMDYVGANDYTPLIHISEALVEEYGTCRKAHPQHDPDLFQQGRIPALHCKAPGRYYRLHHRSSPGNTQQGILGPVRY